MMLRAEIFIDKDKIKGEMPLYEYILHFLLEKKILGATAYYGIAGFGTGRKLKFPNRGFSFDETPLIIVFVDEEEKVREVLKELRMVYHGGVIVTTAVEQW